MQSCKCPVLVLIVISDYYLNITTITSPCNDEEKITVPSATEFVKAIYRDALKFQVCEFPRRYKLVHSRGCGHTVYKRILR